MKVLMILGLVVILATACYARPKDSSSSEEKQKDSDDERPAFLIKATPDQVKEFKELMESSGDKTDKQIDEAVEEWVNKQGGEIKVSRISL